MAEALSGGVVPGGDGDAAQPVLIGRSGDTLREAFGRRLTELARTRSEIIVLDADIAGGTGTHHFRTAFPERFVQCGIAEQNMMAMAGGFASVGLVPVVTTFAVFCLRAVEQARLSIAYAQRNVKIVGSHPGLDVGPDGASAQCLEDLAAYRAIPGMTVISPADPREMAKATDAIFEHPGPVYMRTGRSEAPVVTAEDEPFEIGRGRILVDGCDVSLVACGVEVRRCLDAAERLGREGIRARVVNLSTVKPIDSVLIERCAFETGAIVTAEDHCVHGGLGGAVAECLATRVPCPVEMVGLHDRFGESGEPEALARAFGLDAEGIAAAARRALGRKGRHGLRTPYVGARFKGARS